MNMSDYVIINIMCFNKRTDLTIMKMKTFEENNVGCVPRIKIFSQSKEKKEKQKERRNKN